MKTLRLKMIKDDVRGTESKTCAGGECRLRHPMSLRSRRKSLAQGKRSETKWSEARPWVNAKENHEARFSGRKTFSVLSSMSPAKAGWGTCSHHLPRVPLALLASPWAMFFRLHRRLIESINSSVHLNLRGVLFVIMLVIAPNAVRAQPDQKAPPQTPPQPSPQSAAQSSQRYRIGAGDLLEIRIFNRPQLSRDAVRVEGNGMIRMPLVEDEIQAEIGRAHV